MMGKISSDMMLKNRHLNHLGFTLIEIISVILIISVIMVVIMSRKTEDKSMVISKAEILKSSPDMMSAGGKYSEKNAIKFLQLAMQNKPQSFEWHAKRKNGDPGS